jgi:hypothetical protein
VSALQLYRDDGALAARVASALPRSAAAHQLAWLSPPLVRVAEYGSLIALTRVSAPDRLPFCFAFLAVLAFHHYDSAYRVRHQGAPPPSWVRLAGFGWEGRTLAALALALAGVLGPGLLVGAVALGLLYGVESAFAWIRFARAEGPPARLGAEELE